MAMDVVQLARPQIKEAAEVLARAFHDDPIWSWLQPDKAKRARYLPWFYETWVRYCHKHGEVHTTADRVEGAAVWVPPEMYPLSDVGLMLSGMIFMPLKFGPVAFSRMIRYSYYIERLHRRDAPTRHWYLMILGVDPPRQGQGVGSALIQPVLARADAEGLPCYLETETEGNVPFYNRHGFEVVVEGDLPGGGPHFWTMKREQRA